MKLAKDKSSYLYASLAVLLWASTAAVGKLLLNDLTNIQLIFYTFIFSVIGLFLIVFFQKRLPLLSKYSKKDYLIMAGMGFLGCYVYYLSLFGALMYAPAQEAFIVNYLWPIMVVFFAIIILKEKITGLKSIGIILGFIGVYVVATQGDVLNFHLTNLRGDLLAMLGAVSYGLFSILGKKFNYEKFTSMLIYYSFGFIFVIVTTLFFSSIPKINISQLVGLMWLGVATNALAFVFWFKALEYGDTARMSNIVFLTPFLSLIYIFILLGEKILLSSMVGLILIVSGIMLQSLKKLGNNSVEDSTK